MAHCLSNLSIPQPFAQNRVRKTESSLSPIVAHSWSPRVGRHRSIKAMAADGSSNLDHLQRANKPQTPQQQQQQQRQQPRRRSAQVPPMGLWDRFPTARTVQQMMDTMERLMEDPLAYSTAGGVWPTATPPPPESTVGGGYSRGRTPWEIKEGEGEYKMRFDMPGMTKEDVKVWVEEKMLVLKAQKTEKNEGEEDEGEWSAKSFGRYNCRIALPENVEFGKIKAEVKDGVLYITIPKAHSTSKILDINVE